MKENKRVICKNVEIQLRWENVSGRLLLKIKNDWVVVTIKSCFPWSHCSGNFSLRNKDNEELGFVEKIVDLSEASQAALIASMKESTFYFSIEELLDIDEEFELRTWKVKTRQGFRQFQTRLTDWPRHLSNGFYIIQDVQKDLFVIEDIKNLNASGKKLFWPFMDN